MANPHYSERHWRFVRESINDLNRQLKPFNTHVLCLHEEALDAFLRIQNKLRSFALWSHQEIGLKDSFDRDKAVSRWCKTNNIDWHECTYSGVVRGLKTREQWYERWHQIIESPCADIALDSITWTDSKTLDSLKQAENSLPMFEQNAEGFQNGGERKAWLVMQDFLACRGKDYAKKLSNPSLAQTACSRLSPYLAWGNISSRQIYQTLSAQKHRGGWKRTIRGVQSRLQWRDHFIQKFESEYEMEWLPVNRAYEHFPYEQDPNEVERRLAAWKSGQTGFPIVDASMRCVNQSGYLNFRMRAMLVSFLCHHLNIDWRLGSEHLAAQFLDFEPGIHYPQFQMQAGVTGINAIRLYNPIKQAQDRDPEGKFIREWIPELAHLPNALLHDPSQITEMETVFYNYERGKDYPEPIIDMDQSTQRAREVLWAYQKREDVQKEAQRVLMTHTIPDRSRMLNGPHS